jgi:hypothetical protein
MANNQRLKNHMSTEDRREVADKALSKNRDRNDALTQERRFEADVTLRKNRERNDEITLHRRNLRNKNRDRVIAVSLVIIIGLAIGAYFIFI